MTEFVKFLKTGGGTVAVNPDRVLYVQPMGGCCSLELPHGRAVCVDGDLDWVLDKLESPLRKGD